MKDKKPFFPTPFELLSAKLIIAHLEAGNELTEDSVIGIFEMAEIQTKQ